MKILQLDLKVNKGYMDKTKKTSGYLHYKFNKKVANFIYNRSIIFIYTRLRKVFTVHLSLNEWSSVHEESPFCPLFSWCFCLTVSLFSTDVSTSLCFVLIINNNTCCIWIDCLYRRSAVLTLSSSDCWFDNISKHILLSAQESGEDAGDELMIKMSRLYWIILFALLSMLHKFNICCYIKAKTMKNCCFNKLTLRWRRYLCSTQHTTNKIKQ